jgi:hypothetical protein
MRIVDRNTFLALPAGTLYAKYGDTKGTPNHLYFGEVRIKDGPRGTNDWWSVGFVDGFTSAHNSGDWADTLIRMATSGEEVTPDFETVDSDGLYDDGQLFAVFSPDDHKAMIARLQEALVAVQAA